MAWLDCDGCGMPDFDRKPRIAIIGFGTRGRRLARALLHRGIDVAVFDIAFRDPASPASRALRRIAVREHASIAGAVADCRRVYVTAPREAAVEIARSAAPHHDPDAQYLDLTGASDHPARKVAQALAGVEVTRLDRARAVAMSNWRQPERIDAPAARILPFAPALRAGLRLPHEAAA
jgi:hypothetical protein